MNTAFYVTAIVVAVGTILLGAWRLVATIGKVLIVWEDIATQFRPNHGTSLVDRVEKMEDSIVAIRAVLDEGGDSFALRRLRERQEREGS